MRFYTSGLLSKWGFKDGDILDDLLWDSGLCGTGKLGDDSELQEHDVLTKIIQDYVLPKITDDVKTCRIMTIHNPIRAEFVNGVSVEWTNSKQEIKINPEFVEVPDELIIQVAKNLRKLNP